MNNTNINQCLLLLSEYFGGNLSKDEQNIVEKEIREITSEDIDFSNKHNNELSYDDIQSILGSLNENGSAKKEKGIYYTPLDLVSFIVINSVKSFYRMISPDNVHVLDTNGVPYEDFCFKNKMFDPTCGTGEFLLYCLNLKFDLLELHKIVIDHKTISIVLKTIYGNDIDEESTLISKLRIFLCCIKRYGVKNISGIGKKINNQFSNFDYINHNCTKKYNIVIGNPPYVEDSKYRGEINVIYGNVYGNVLANASKELKGNGVIGFVIPLSYVSTPRMERLRNDLSKELPEEYIINYCDRPDCLFSQVHQKLSIIICSNFVKDIVYYTSNYSYWYKEERSSLFLNTKTVENDFFNNKFISKLGNANDINIIHKMQMFRSKLYDLISQDKNSNYPIYLNMRAAFWIKCFKKSHVTSEYKEYFCKDESDANYVFCLLNSSLFWWFWTCISDCWHITSKELKLFKTPPYSNTEMIKKLASNLQKRLEKTKVFVGTKQTDYEYKHKLCRDEISDIDDYICSLFGLTNEETLYIKNFKLKYRIGGGPDGQNN